MPNNLVSGGTTNRSLFSSLKKTVVIAFATFLIYASGDNKPAVPAEAADNSFGYQFSVNGTLSEASTVTGSSSPYWWLRRGGYLNISGGTGRTIQDELPSGDKYRLKYAQIEPLRSDNGYHPQNIFELYLKQKKGNSDQQIYVKVNEDNLAQANIHPWNGISLVSRYQDDGSFYFAEVRMDGKGVIKKFVDGKNYTLSQATFFSGTYDPITRPSLIPKSKFFGIRQKTETMSNGGVKIQLLADVNGSGNWQIVTESIDGGQNGNVIKTQGYSGIQSDYMDLEMDNYLISDLTPSSSPSPSATPTPTPTASATPTPTSTPTPTPSATPISGSLFSDSFSQYPDGLITNEYAFWNPTGSGAKVSSKWELTSGSLFAQNGSGWTGVPDGGIAPNALSTNANNSAIFRLTTKQANFRDVAVTFDLLNQGLTSTSVTPAVAWDGVHVFLRYQSEQSLYYASINRRDNTVVVKKKVPGGPSNGGTYYTLASTGSYAVPYNAWQNVKATIKNNSDGSVTIQLFAGGKLLLTANDNGVGGAPITGYGKVGIRGDNTNFKFKNFLVSSF